MEPEESNYLAEIAETMSSLKNCHFFISDGLMYVVSQSGEFTPFTEVDSLIESLNFKIFENLDFIKERFHQYELKLTFSTVSLTGIRAQYRQVWSSLVTQFDEAFKAAKMLSEKYGVDVAVIDTMDEYNSEKIIETTASKRIYFVCRERDKVEFSAFATERLIKHDRFRDLSLINYANKRRTEKADITALSLIEKITDIENEFRETNDGKNPPLSTVAAILSERGIEAPNGGSKWFAQTVKRIIERAQIKRE